MKNLTAEDFKKSVPMKSIDIPELNGRVWVKAFTYSEMQQLSKISSNYDMLILAIVDEQGKPIFSQETIKHLEQMDFKSGLIEKLVDEVLEFNNIKPDAAKKN